MTRQLLPGLQAARAAFNALSLRERLLAVAAGVALVYFALDFTLFAVQRQSLARAQQALSRLAQQETELAAELQRLTLRLAQDPAAPKRAELRAVQQTIAELEALIDDDRDGQQLGRLLRELIKGSPGLRLVSIKTLPTTPVYELRLAADGQTLGPGQSGEVSQGVYRYGVDLGIEGSYLALLPYLQRLQAQTTPLLWGTLTLDVGAHPQTTFRLTVHALTRRPKSRLG